MKKFTIILVTIFLNGCSANHSERKYSHPALKNIEFLQFKRKQTEWLEALVVGKLVLDNSCFKFTDGSIIIFPASFYLDIKDGKVVIKEGSKIVGIEGKVISTGGGWVPSIEPNLINKKPNKCESKKGYFVVGQGFKLK